MQVDQVKATFFMFGDNVTVCNKAHLERECHPVLPAEVFLTGYKFVIGELLASCHGGSI